MREYIIGVPDNEPLSSLRRSGKTITAIAKIVGNCDEVIRCRNCKYYTGKWCTKLSTKQLDINDICKADDDFCSMAERAEE